MALQQSAEVHSELACDQLTVRLVPEEDDPVLGQRLEPEPHPEHEEINEAGLLRLVDTLQIEEVGHKGQFSAGRVELSRAGVLTVDQRPAADLTKPGTRVGQPQKARSGRPFCVRIDCADLRSKIVLDLGNVEQQHRWLTEMQAVASPPTEISNTQRDYMHTFAVFVGEEELKRFTIGHRAARAVHEELDAAPLV